jgi:hypothetical protein
MQRSTATFCRRHLLAPPHIQQRSYAMKLTSATKRGGPPKQHIKPLSRKDIPFFPRATELDPTLHRLHKPKMSKTQRLVEYMYTLKKPLTREEIWQDISVLKEFGMIFDMICFELFWFCLLWFLFF